MTKEDSEASLSAVRQGQNDKEDSETSLTAVRQVQNDKRRF